MRQKNKTIDNTGFSNLSAAEANRLSNKDGSFNVKRVGIPFFQRYSILHTLLKMKRRRFILLIVLYYLLVNSFFALIYFIIGVGDLQ